MISCSGLVALKCQLLFHNTEMYQLFFVQVFPPFLGQRRRILFFGGVLHFAAVGWCYVLVWLVSLSVWRSPLETVQCFMHISTRHGNMHLAFLIIPVQGLVLLDYRQQMFGMLFAYIFDSKIIYHKIKTDWLPLVRPKTRGILLWVYPSALRRFFKSC